MDPSDLARVPVDEWVTGDNELGRRAGGGFIRRAKPRQTRIVPSKLGQRELAVGVLEPSAKSPHELVGEVC